MRSLRTVVSSLSILVVAVAGPARASQSSPTEMPPVEPTSVIGFIDTGINPYHVTFSDRDNPWSYEHPATYIEGYPEDAIALPITLDEPDWHTAVQMDCALWQSVEPGRLYWFPGTKIVGAISFNERRTFDCATVPNDGTTILDNHLGHGTMVASRGASNEYGSCPECRIVAVQHDHTSESDVAALRWTADAGWIDMQSNSWASLVPLWEPTGAGYPQVASPELVRASEYAATKHLAFWATMNGALYQGGTLGHPSSLAPHLGPSVIAVGAHDSGYVTAWAGSGAHLASDGCNSWAASWTSTTHSSDTIGFGTSAATPFVAGGAARLILQARELLGDLRTGVRGGDVVAQGASGLVPSGPLADGVFTMAEVREVLLKTATERPEAHFEDGSRCQGTATPQWITSPVRWTDLPAEFPEYLLIGYGAVDRPALALASRILRGKASLPDREETDRYFTVDHQIRSAKYTALRGVD